MVFIFMFNFYVKHHVAALDENCMCRYGVGAAANVYDVITWRHLYGTEAALMLVCGSMYCFMSPKMIQVVS